MTSIKLHNCILNIPAAQEALHENRWSRYCLDIPRTWCRFAPWRFSCFTWQIGSKAATRSLVSRKSLVLQRRGCVLVFPSSAKKVLFSSPFISRMKTINTVWWISETSGGRALILILKRSFSHLLFYLNHLLSCPIAGRWMLRRTAYCAAFR